MLAYILDMDGVILHSNALHAEAWRLYLSRYQVPADSMMERMHGKRNDEIVRGLFGPHLTEQEVFAHGAAKEALYREMMRPQLAGQLVAGLIPFLERNATRPLAVASNAEPANLDFVLDEGGLRKYFKVVMDGHQVEHPKPSPEIYLKVARMLDVPPSHCVVFEDSSTGIAAAQRAGMHTVAVSTTDAVLPPTSYAMKDFADRGLDQFLRGLEV
ncbi:MAG: HAD-IA family hydrolase [Acidobacteria bacterium]|nr:HAD-IA family hydrolase [Acidobacteriota bacterium]